MTQKAASSVRVFGWVTAYANALRMWIANQNLSKEQMYSGPFSPPLRSSPSPLPRLAPSDCLVHFVGLPRS
jgi:hypothetical protein